MSGELIIGVAAGFVWLLTAIAIVAWCRWYRKPASTTEKKKEGEGNEGGEEKQREAQGSVI